MKLTIVGCAGSTAGPFSAASCYLLEAESDGRTWRVVLDLGSGAIGPLQRYCDPATLDAVFVSHGHPDHCADLSALSVLRRYGPTKDDNLAPLPLYGPEGIDRRIVEVAGGDPATELAPFAWTPLSAGDQVSVGPLALVVEAAWHPVPALAVRIVGPSHNGGTATLVYTGDTDRTDAIDALCADADLLLAEAGWAHREVNPPGVHLNGAQVGELARDAGVDRVILTHVASWVDPEATLVQARDAVGDRAVLARPGDVYSL